MSVIAEDLDRRLVPRWRFARQALSSAEFAADPRLTRPSRVARHYLDEKLAEWREQQDLGRAIDLVGCGIGGGWLDDVRPAAEYLSAKREQLSPQVRRVVSHALQQPKSRPPEPPTSATLTNSASFTFDIARLHVATTRQRLRNDARCTLSWLDLARGYAILGHTAKATWAVERALHLAPNHRHVLRSAARLFVHTGELGRAHALLTRNPRSPTDPWLMAAELAIAKIADHKPRFAGRARKLINSGDLPPEHLTELQSSLGTLEYYNGAERRAYKDIRGSLEAPTDNSVAQARWIRTQLPAIAISESLFQLPQSFEARCWQALEDGRWENAQQQCFEWLRDEPFSSRPAEVGSYIGISLMDDPDFAVACAAAGLQAEPTNAGLHNNIAVALAYRNELDRAIEHFSRVTTPLPPDFPEYVYVATAGLLCFRSGDIERGRSLYARAEATAPADRKVRVAVFHAREELNAATAESTQYVSRALKIGEATKNIRTKRLLSLLEQQQAAPTGAAVPAHASDGQRSAHRELLPKLTRTARLAGGTDVVISSTASVDSHTRIIMPSKSNSHTGFRSSVTGQFVKEGYAKRYPNRTQKEAIPNPGRGDTGRKK